MNILRGAFAPGRNGGGGGGKGGGGAGGDEKPHAQAKLLSPTEKCKVIFLFHQPWFCIRKGLGEHSEPPTQYYSVITKELTLFPLLSFIIYSKDMGGGGGLSSKKVRFIKRIESSA